MKKKTLYTLISFNLLITSCSVEPSKDEQGHENEGTEVLTLGSDEEAPLVDEGAKTPLPDLALTSVVHSYYTITVKDRATNLPISGVKLKTTNRIEFTSDINGKIAFFEPGLMATRVWFSVSHPGYAAQKDAIGIAGASFSMSEGGSGDLLLDKTSNATVAADNYQTRLLASPVPGPNESHAIRVIDKVSRRGVPLVFLVDEKGVTRLTDSQGYLAYHHLDEMNKSHSFTITSHGYVGTSKTLTATPGATTEIELERRMIAERLYRTTGQGIYRESYLLGLTMPTKNPNVNGLVMGQDTVDSTLYKGKIFWTWQDTDRVGYALGSFANTAATSLLPASGGLNPDLGVDRDYYVGSDGFAKAIAPDFAPTSSLTWLGDLVAIPDASGEERLYGRFAKVGGDGSANRKGWALFDDAAAKFRDLNLAANDPVLDLPSAPLRFKTPSGDKFYFGLRRVAATAEALFDGSQHESFTAYKSGSKNLDTDANGNPVYSWKKGTEVSTEADLATLGVSADYQLNDGHKFKGLNGEGLGISGSQLNKVWNPYRQKFVGTIQQALGTPSTFGEMWFAEGDTPMGPWNYAVKVVSHDNYTSYNVKQDGLLMQNNGRKIYIEGTYTASFTQNAIPTVRYNYNQVIYRLDLADQKLRLPVAVYEMESAAKRDYAVKGDIHLGTSPLAARFFAMDRPTTGMIGLGWNAPSCAATRKLVALPEGDLNALFYAMPADLASTPNSQALYEYANGLGQHVYSTASAVDGYTASKTLVARVWKSSSQAKVPVADFLGDVIAHAGDDRCISKGSAPSTPINLDASSSKGNGLSYKWVVRGKKINGTTINQSVSGKTGVFNLSNGFYTIELTVTDAKGVKAVDHSLVQVK